MKVSRPINLSNVSNPLHQAGFQQQIWLGKVSWIWDVCPIYNRQHKWCMTVSGVINALRGHGNFSQVTSNRTLKNKYDPTEGEFNFPIPSIPTLKKLDIGFPSEIPVGFVEQSLQLAEMKSKSGAQIHPQF